MRSIITTIALLFAFSLSSAFGQANNFDERLLVKYSSDEIKQMDAETLAFNTYCIDNAFEVMPFPVEKEGDAAINGARNIQDLSNINFFELSVELKEDQYQYFKLLGTDKMLMIKPISLIKQEL